MPAFSVVTGDLACFDEALPAAITRIGIAAGISYSKLFMMRGEIIALYHWSCKR